MDARAWLVGATAAVFLLWLPGWVWSHILFPRMPSGARVPLAVALSIALVTVAVYLASLGGGATISAEGAIWYAGALFALGVGYQLARRLTVGGV